MKFLRKILLSIILLLVLGAALAAYAFLIEPNRLVVKSYTIQKKPDGDYRVRIVQLSDLEISKNYSEDKLPALVKKVNSLSPDIIVFTGDLFQNYSQYHPVAQVTDALGSMKATYGKYAVPGNRDYGGGAARHYPAILEEAGFTLLQNEGVNLSLAEGKKLFIGGLDDVLLGHPDAGRTLAQLDTDSHFKLFLCHEPDYIDMTDELPVDLILAGHSHGGQVRFPFLPKVTTSLAEIYTNGFYQPYKDKDTRLYVNSGLGMSHIPVRFMVPPQIAVFDIVL